MPGSDAGQSELNLRLDGVQKKWGRPTYPPSTPTSTADTVKIPNGVTHSNSVRTSSLRTPEVSYDSTKPQVEISLEKQKMAALLFGGTSKSERRHHSAGLKESSKSQNHSSDNKIHEALPAAVKPSQPPPDLLDLSEPSIASCAPSVDHFKQLEGLLDLKHDMPR